LLGRYIAEERDSGRLLRGCYQCLCDAAHASSNGGKADKAARASAKRLAALETKVDTMSRSLGEIKKLVRSSQAASVN
jgi:hypothetical protein